jgi:hypothetical protein
MCLTDIHPGAETSRPTPSSLPTSSTATGTLVTPGSRPHGLPGHQANLQAPRQSSSPSAQPPASTAALTTRGTSPTALSRIRHRLGARTGAHRPLSRRRGEGRRTRGDGQPSPARTTRTLGRRRGNEVVRGLSCEAGLGWWGRRARADSPAGLPSPRGRHAPTVGPARAARRSDPCSGRR